MVRILLAIFVGATNSNVKLDARQWRKAFLLESTGRLSEERAASVLSRHVYRWSFQKGAQCLRLLTPQSETTGRNSWLGGTL